MSGEFELKNLRLHPGSVFSQLVLSNTLVVILALTALGLTGRHYFKKKFLEQTQEQIRLSFDVAFATGTPPRSICNSPLATQSESLVLTSSTGTVLCKILRSTDSTLEINYTVPASGEHIEARYSLPKLAQALSTFDSFLLATLAAISIFLWVFAVAGKRYLIRPAKRLRKLAQEVRVRTSGVPSGESANSSNGKADGSIAEAWNAIDSSIDSIRRDLQKTTESLSLEREELATLMSAITDAVLAVDTDGVPLFYNTRFALNFNQKDLKLQDTRIKDVIFAPDAIVKAYESALEMGEPAHVEAVPFELVSGRRYFSVSVSPLRRGSEKVYGAVGIFHDVTELKQTEQIRIDFVANVSHELRTPLTAIQGYTETLLQDSAEGRSIGVDFLQVIARNADRLIHLINDLLDLSALESHVDLPAPEELSTTDLTRRIVEQMENKFRRKRHQLVTICNESTVYADPRRIEQVLVNLLDNARKYTPPDGKIFVIWESGKNETILKVKDTGPGIAQEHHGRLFERFYRVDKARSREMGGTGLGLAIVKHIMQFHHGSVSIQSVPGSGCSFICKFPSADLRPSKGFPGDEAHEATPEILR